MWRSYSLWASKDYGEFGPLVFLSSRYGCNERMISRDLARCAPHARDILRDVAALSVGSRCASLGAGRVKYSVEMSTALWFIKIRSDGREWRVTRRDTLYSSFVSYVYRRTAELATVDG